MLRRALSGMVMYTVFGALAAHAGQFLEAPQYPTGASPQAVALGDFRADGKLDLVIANAAGNTIGVLLGNGDGTFQTQTTYATDTSPQGVAIADFNNDGNLDIAVTNSGSNTVSVFLGNGDGTFQSKVDFPTASKPQGIAAADLRGDGNFDIVVTNAATSPPTVGVLLGNGKGSFSAEVNYNTGNNPWAVAIGDFNNDGIPDLAVANNNDNDAVSVLLGNGDGTFQGQIQYATGSTPISIAIADFNGDGNKDIAVADQQGNTVSILLGTGKGSFAAHVDYPTGAFPTGVTVGDFNGDGIPDLAVSDGDGNTVSVLWGKGDGTFEAQLNVGTGDIPYAVAAGNFGNGVIDLVTANSGGNTVSVILSNGTNKTFQARTDFLAGPIPASLNVGPNPFSVATADFNGDGIPDLAVASGNCPAAPPTCGVAIMLGKGDGTFQAPSQYSSGDDTGPHAIVAGKFNGDGFEDLAVANYNSGTVGILLGNGDGTFQLGTSITVGTRPSSIAVGDFNGDGIPDLAVTNFHTNNVSVLLGNGNGKFTEALGSPYATGNGPISVAVGAFSGGTVLDLVVVNETDNTAGILLGKGDGTFQPETAQTTYSTGSGGNPLAVAVGDLNGDGILDLAVADFKAQQVSVLLGNGNGTFQTFVPYSTGGSANPSSVVIADFNGDGVPDLALTSRPLSPYPGNLVSLLLGNGDGTFQPPTLFGTGSEAYSAVVGDFNGDGALDLAIANGVSDTVSILLNTQGTAMNLESSAQPSSFNQSVTLTATVSASVSNGMGAPTGSVTVMNGSTILGTPGPLVNGQYSVNTSTLPVGVNSLSAVYTSNNGYQKHTVSLTQTVRKAGTTTALTSSATSSTLNQLVTFAATVSPSTSGQPTGTVTFLDGTTPLGSPALSGEVATLAISTLAIGTHTITASYSGDVNFNVSTSSVVNLVVVAAATPDFSLSSSPASLSVAAGASGQSTITINPLGGLNPSTVALTCSITTTLSPAPTCSLGAISVANNTGTSMLTVATTGAQAALVPAPEHGSRWLLALGLLMPAMLLSAAGLGTPGRRRLLAICLIFLVLSGCLLQVACGGSGSNSTPPATKTNPSTPAGTYTVTITGNASGEQHTTSVSLTVQ